MNIFSMHSLKAISHTGLINEDCDCEAVKKNMKYAWTIFHNTPYPYRNPGFEVLIMVMTNWERFTFQLFLDYPWNFQPYLPLTSEILYWEQCLTSSATFTFIFLNKYSKLMYYIIFLSSNTCYSTFFTKKYAIKYVFFSSIHTYFASIRNTCILADFLFPDVGDRHLKWK